jgi:hypothetical protein
MKTYGCIGKKLTHSFSREIHRELADYEYELMQEALRKHLKTSHGYHGVKKEVFNEGIKVGMSMLKQFHEFPRVKDGVIMRPCAKCGEVKEICCMIDGEPWCEDCFDKALRGELDAVR